MSKLRDRIRDRVRRRPAAFGFAAMRSAAQAASSRQLLVAAEVADATQAQAAAADHADVLIYTGALSGLAAITAAAGTAVVGARVDQATATDAAAVLAAGADFLVTTDEADARAMLEVKLGYVLVATSSVTPNLGTDDATSTALRSVRSLDLDGVLVGGLPETMTVRQQLHARRLSALVRRPLFVRVSGPVSAETLELWRDAGVVAVVGGPELTAALATAADAVPAPRERKDEHRDVVVPAPHASMDDEDDDDDDEP